MSIYSRYLNRVISRMENPATVPSRGFIMGGPENFGTLHDDFGQYFQSLNLPWLAEFTGGHSSSFNWMSQLLAGPRGCINYGAFNGSLFDNERNRRYCRYGTLGTVYVPGNNNPTRQIVHSADSLGWEWAGLYGHSCPTHTNFFSDQTFEFTGNGTFGMGTLGPFWGSRYLRSGGCHGGLYHYYQDDPTAPNPYAYGYGWKGKSCQWRWPVTATGNYNVYLWYQASSGNCDAVNGSILRVSLDADGVPASFIDSREYRVNQRIHATNPLTDPATELISSNMVLNQGEMAIVTLGANADASQHRGDYIADAIRLISAPGGPGVDIVIRSVEPVSYPEVDDRPFTIFSTSSIHPFTVFRGGSMIGNSLRAMPFYLCFLLSVSATNAYSTCVEGIDTTDADGRGLDGAFKISDGKISGGDLPAGFNDRCACYYFYVGTSNGYFNHSFDDIKTAPAFQRKSYWPKGIFSNCFVWPKKDSTYSKVQILKKLQNGRHVYRYVTNKKPNDPVFVNSDYDRSVRYKPNNVYMGLRYECISVHFFDTLYWEPPLPNNNHLIGYILYQTKPGANIDTTAPINFAQWDSVAFTETTILPIDPPLQHKRYFNLVAAYTEGKSDFLEGWAYYWAQFTGSLKNRPAPAGSPNTIRLKKTASGFFIDLQLPPDQTVSSSVTINSIEGRRVARFGDVRSKRIFWNTSRGTLADGLYIVKVELPDGVIARTLL